MPKVQFTGAKQKDIGTVDVDGTVYSKNVPVDVDDETAKELLAGGGRLSGFKFEAVEDEKPPTTNTASGR